MWNNASKTGENGFSTRDEFFYSRNTIIYYGGSGIIFVCCVFWLLVDIVAEDKFFLFSTYAIYGVIAMMAAAAYIHVLPIISKSIANPDKKRLMYRISIFAYYVAIIIGITLITVADNVQRESLGLTEETLSVALVSFLLIIPAIAPLPSLPDGLVLGMLAIASTFFPKFTIGAPAAYFLPDLLVKIGLTSTYIVFYRRTSENYTLSRSLYTNNALLLESNMSLKKASQDIVDLLGNVVEARDMDSGKHINRVKIYTRILAEKYREMHPESGLTANEIESIVGAASLHDVGKIMIPDAVLLKPGKLTDEEYEKIKEHTVLGTKILESMPQIKNRHLTEKAVEICRWHHERWDGSGYPDGLSGDDIPLSAQIVGVADCFDALNSDRPYKKAYDPHESLRMIISGECGAFSPAILDTLEKCSENLLEISETIR